MRPSDEGWVNYLGWLFISPRGRIPRSVYWAAKLSLALILFVVLAIFAAVGSTSSRGDSWLWIPFVLYLFAIVSVAVKRLHDQEMSGIWVLACLVPYLGELFGFIVLGCLKGDEGSNKYGPDPLEPEKAET